MRPTRMLHLSHQPTISTPRRVRPNHLAVALIIWQVPSVSSRIFAAWGCERFGSAPGADRYYLRVDLSIECYSDEHLELQRIALGFIIVWAIGVPCIYAVLLAKARANPESVTTCLYETPQKIHPRSARHLICVATLMTGALVHPHPDTQPLEPCQQLPAPRLHAGGVLVRDGGLAAAPRALWLGVAHTRELLLPPSDCCPPRVTPLEFVPAPS